MHSQDAVSNRANCKGVVSCYYDVLPNSNHSASVKYGIKTCKWHHLMIANTRFFLVCNECPVLDTGVRI